jgi:hypothetical protein
LPPNIIEDQPKESVAYPTIVINDSVEKTWRPRAGVPINNKETGHVVLKLHLPAVVSSWSLESGIKQLSRPIKFLPQSPAGRPLTGQPQIAPDPETLAHRRFRRGCPSCVF